MIATYDSTHERISKEKIRATVINEGRWKGHSEEFRMACFYDYIIVKDDLGFNVEVGAGDLVVKAEGFGKFDSAFIALEELDRFMNRYFYQMQAELAPKT